MHTVAVAGDGRALWQAVPAVGNTLIDVDVYAAAPRASATRVVAAIELSYDQWDPDYVGSVPLPVAAEGNELVFYARCDNGLFKGGRAVAVTFAVACGAIDCGEDFEEQIVKLRR